MTNIEELDNDSPAFCDICKEYTDYWTVFDDDVIVCSTCLKGYPDKVEIEV
jgi:hypothetical protein